MIPPGRPGRLIGSGRSADVYDVGAGRVLRRYRMRADVAAEAALMTHLRAAGFPAPQVFDADGPDLVMERLTGADMLADLARRPWRVRRHARLLARLHDQLHAVVAPPGLRQPFGDGTSVLHLDLHPGNVMLTADGPVVIDWSNVAAGPPGADVAVAQLIMTVSEVDSLPIAVRPVAGQVRRTFVRDFVAHVDADPDRYLALAARYRIGDPNTRPAEADWLRRFI
jgi:aminoglycoside phosphotransferase (APT) family kinase protein